MALDTSSDALHPDLTITKENRSQYFETAIASVADADREIRQAEARGRERRARENELRHTLKRIAWGLLALLVVGAGAGLTAYLLR